MQKLLIDKFPKRSTGAWVILALYILIYDIIAMAINDIEKNKSGEKRFKETFSDGCWRGVSHPVVRWPIWFSIAVLVKHLAAPDFLRKYDPIGLVGKAVTFVKRGLGYGR